MSDEDIVKERLLKVFKNSFGLTDSESIIAEIATVEEWDSFSHMGLMIELQAEFELKEITGEDFARLVSFQLIYKYVLGG